MFRCLVTSAALCAIGCSGGSASSDGGAADAAADAGSADGGSLDGGCTTIGDPTQAIQIEPHFMDRDNAVKLIQPNTAVPLIFAPQGGFTVNVTPFVKNTQGCLLTVTASLRDPCANNTVLVLDQRQLTYELNGEGWGQPTRLDSFSNFNNVGVCPVTYERQMYDRTYNLRLAVQDGAGRMAETIVPIKPSCEGLGTFQDGCTCQCGANYVLGGKCGTTSPACN